MPANTRQGHTQTSTPAQKAAAEDNVAPVLRKQSAPQRESKEAKQARKLEEEKQKLEVEQKRELEQELKSMLREELPSKPPEMSNRDYLIMLLHIAAELEHGLMVQYLYAAYSLTTEGLNPTQQKKVIGWRDHILTVAKEEMGHLLTVQNLLCLIGGPISFNRENFPWDTQYSPVPFRLEKLSLESLSCYVFAEMPKDFSELEAQKHRKGSFADRFLRTEKRKMLAVVLKLINGRPAHPVGALYEKLLEIIGNPNTIPDDVFRADTVTYQASWDDWGRGYKPPPARPGQNEPPHGARKSSVIIEQMATRTEVLAALRAVAGQGEAAHVRSHLQEEPSHFDQFVEIYMQWDPKLAAKAVRQVPLNPTTIAPRKGRKVERDGEPVEPAFIENPVAQLWAGLLNIRYRILLTYLTHTFRLARGVDPDSPNARGAVMHRIFGEMYNLKAISGILVRLPLKKNQALTDSDRAGPPFQMPYTLAMPVDELDCWHLHRDILQSAIRLCKDLLKSADGVPEGVAHEAENYLRTLRDLDDQTLDWIDHVMQGVRAHPRTHA